MKGYQINKFTDLKDLRSTLKSFPDPVPGEGEVLVDIYSAGLNFFDILMAAGASPSAEVRVHMWC